MGAEVSLAFSPASLLTVGVCGGDQLLEGLHFLDRQRSNVCLRLRNGLAPMIDLSIDNRTFSLPIRCMTDSAGVPDTKNVSTLRGKANRRGRTQDIQDLVELVNCMDIINFGGCESAKQRFTDHNYACSQQPWQINISSSLLFAFEERFAQQ